MSEKQTRYSKMNSKEKNRAVVNRKRLRHLQSAQVQVSKLKSTLKELSEKFASSFIFPHKQEQIAFLFEWLDLDCSHLTDLELKTKYATALLIRQDFPKSNKKQFKKRYEVNYFEYGVIFVLKIKNKSFASNVIYLFLY